MILDIYFRRPIFWDYLIALFAVWILFLLFKKEIIFLPSEQESYALTGDLTNIALTFVGFILTILTVLITFKDTSASKKNIDDEPAFNKFFSTDFYYETIRHLKNCIKSISTVAAMGFFLKLFLSSQNRIHLFFFNIIGLIIIMLSVYRCLIILGKILQLQRNS